MIPGWKKLEDLSQLEEIKNTSNTRNILIFKHSTRCSISDMALRRMYNLNSVQADCYFLDLLAHRIVSNAVAETFGVYHESPQVLIIRNGECVYDESHNAIRADEIEEQLTSAA